MDLTTVAVACTNSEGRPDILFISFYCSPAEYAEGLWKARAIEAAEHDGCEGPFVCFGPKDQAAIVEAAEGLSGVNTLPIINKPFSSR